MTPTTPTLTVAQVKRLGLKHDQPKREPGELIACFARGRLVNGKNASRGWQMKAWGRYKRVWRAQTLDALLMANADRGPIARGSDATPKVVTFHAIVPSRFDSDGLALACAPIRDALITAGVIDDDRDSAGHSFTYTQEARRKAGTVYGVFVRVKLR